MINIETIIAGFDKVVGKAKSNMDKVLEVIAVVNLVYSQVFVILTMIVMDGVKLLDTYQKEWKAILEIWVKATNESIGVVMSNPKLVGDVMKLKPKYTKQVKKIEELFNNLPE